MQWALFGARKGASWHPYHGPLWAFATWVGSNGPFADTPLETTCPMFIDSH